MDLDELEDCVRQESVGLERIGNQLGDLGMAAALSPLTTCAQTPLGTRQSSRLPRKTAQYQSHPFKRV